MAAIPSLVSGTTGILMELVSAISSILASEDFGAVEHELQKLQHTLKKIALVTEDAETKQATETAVGVWLRKLNEVVYDTDDVLDEFLYESMRLDEIFKEKDKVTYLSSSLSIAFSDPMTKKVEDINRNLGNISSDIDVLQLHPSTISILTDQKYQLASSLVDDPEFFGRENDKSKIIEMLTVDTSSSQSSLLSEKNSVLSLVGVGGIGKTTLAQLVYKDELIEKHFEPLMWVCVKDFHVLNILQKILESPDQIEKWYFSPFYSSELFLPPPPPRTPIVSDVLNFDILSDKVKQKLRGKKYLLVLDGLCNESVTEWNKLKSILNVGDGGSKILVTTSSRIVEYNVRGLLPPSYLKHLSNDECWSIIRKKAFSVGGALLTPSMCDIGREISKKCAGLPLAAIFFGNLMHLHNTETYWLSIRDDVGLNTSTDNPNETIPILKFSYDILPSHLKQCFSYTSIFRKGWEIEKEKLVQLWMAEGFLQPSIGGSQQSMEDIGNDYFQSLLGRSFFEVVKTDKLGEAVLFKIHDLLIDQKDFENARSVHSRDELMILDASTCFQKDFENASEVRRLHLILDDKNASKKVLDAASKLRTFFASESTNLGLDDLVSNKRLRVVCLGDVYHKKECLADVIGMKVTSSLKFMHLRYLDLSGFRFREVNEVSVGELYNLQTLVLSYCVNVQNILKDVGSLKKLRHLYLSSSDVLRLPYSITSIRHLQTLNLDHCRQFKDLPDDIGSLDHLKSLNLSHTPITELPDSLSRIRNLRRLDIVGCWQLNSLPRDLGELTQLKCLDLSGTRIKVLPESCYQNLSNLEIVKLGSLCFLPKEIKNWANLKSLTGGRYEELPRGIESLTCLQELKLYSKTGSVIEKLANLNSLQMLYIEVKQVGGGKKEAETAKLKEKPKIRELFLNFGYSGMSENADKERSRDDEMVLEGLEPHSNLNFLRIQYFQGLGFAKWMIGLPNLVELVLSDCNNCEYLPTLGLLPCLGSLYIDGMSSLKCLGEEFYGNSMEVAPSFFPSLVQLMILGSPNLEEWAFPPPSLHNSFPLLKRLSIKSCWSLRTVPNSFHTLKELELWGTNGEAVNSILCSKGGGLTSLTSIIIDYIDDLIHFPLGALRNNTCLQSLKIKSCENLKGFDDDLSPAAFGRTITNSYLYTLSITYCPALSSLPDLRLWTSLRELEIYRCDKLNKESIPYDLESLVFIETMNFKWLIAGNCKEIISVTPNSSIFNKFRTRTKMGTTVSIENLQVLHIRNLENVGGGKEDAEDARLQELKRLRHLYLCWDSLDEEDNYRSVNDADVLEGLKPHTNVRKLTISGFEGSMLPEWMMGSSSNCLPNLVELYLLECNNCVHLIALGMLPCLKVLQIKGMNSVKCLGKEFYCLQEEISSRERGREEITTEIQATATASSSSGTPLFPSLLELSLIDMSNLEEWIAPPHHCNSFPFLETLIVSRCARLKSIPLASCSSLKSLELRDTNNEALNSILANQGRAEQLTSLASVSIQDSPQLIYFPVVLAQRDSYIRSLEIVHCSNFKGLRILENNSDPHATPSPDAGFNTSISSLCSLKLNDCPALESLPDLRKWTCLTALWIEDCDKLKEFFPYDLESLANLKTLYVDCLIDLSEDKEVDLPATIHLLQHQTI